jgi:hypothetical protein
LHVLATPPAFVLSQDQTLQFVSSNPPSPKLRRISSKGSTLLHTRESAEKQCPAHGEVLFKLIPAGRIPPEQPHFRCLFGLTVHLSNSFAALQETTLLISPTHARAGVQTPRSPFQFAYHRTNTTIVNTRLAEKQKFFNFFPLFSRPKTQVPPREELTCIFAFANRTSCDQIPYTNDQIPIQPLISQMSTDRDRRTDDWGQRTVGATTTHERGFRGFIFVGWRLAPPLAFDIQNSALANGY